MAVGSLFRRSGRSRDTDEEAKTIEVSASVIAEAVRAGERGTDRAGDSFDRDMGDQNVTDELLEQALAERRSLVQLCLYALDRARSSGVAERIEEGLSSVGVTALRPDGDRFDPAHHEAGGTVPTEDAGMEGLVAETEVVGFSDRGRLLRAPVVTVYTARNGPTS